MSRLKYYLTKLKDGLISIFSPYRIKRFGLKIAFLDFVIFMCHRSGSNFQLRVIRAKDKDVQKYIHANYESILKKYREE